MYQHLLTSVAGPDHFDADPDPTSEKTGCSSGSGSEFFYPDPICSTFNFLTRYFCLKMAYETYLLT
jgi:hypothetical protein